jgi:hypothetical protein
LKDRSPFFEFGTQGGSVHQISIVGDSKPSPCRVHHERLSVLQVAGTGRGITHMANGTIAFELLEITRMKNLGYKSHSFMGDEGWSTSFGRYDSGAFLSSVLQSEQTVVSEHRSIRVVEDREDAAFVSWFVQVGSGRFQGRAKTWTPRTKRSRILKFTHRKIAPTIFYDFQDCNPTRNH